MGYLMLNPVYAYDEYVWFVNEYFGGNIIFKWVRNYLFAHS